jgi:hypothetical protein
VIAPSLLCLVSPFATGALLGTWPRARRLAARHYPLLIAFGAGGLGLVVLGAFVLPRPASLVALALGGPLSGLSFWARRTDGDDDGPGGDDDDEPDPPPPGDDWDRIVREIERHVERHAGPTTPSRDAAPERRKPASPALV